MPKCHYGKARCIRGAQTAWAGGLRWNNDNALHSKSTDVPFNTRFQSDRTPFLHRVNKTCTHRLSRHTPFVYMCILYRKRKWAIQNATSTLSDKRGRHRRVLKKKKQSWAGCIHGKCTRRAWKVQPTLTCAAWMYQCANFPGLLIHYCFLLDYLITRHPWMLHFQGNVSSWGQQHQKSNKQKKTA